jgi:hypothetical protein
MPMVTQIDHTKWPCLVKLVILIWLTNLLAMPTKVFTYLPTCLNMFVLPTYICPTYLCLIYLCPTYYLPKLHNYLPIYLYFNYIFTYILTYSLHK